MNSVIFIAFRPEKRLGALEAPTDFRTAKKLKVVIKLVLGEKQYFLTWEHFKYVSNEGKHWLEAIEKEILNVAVQN